MIPVTDRMSAHAAELARIETERMVAATPRSKALYDRAVGLYASLVNINAYHQPGVEAGKKAATAVLTLQTKVAAALTGSPQTAVEIAGGIGADTEAVYHVLNHLAANRGHVKVHRGACPDGDRFHAAS